MANPTTIPRGNVLGNWLLGVALTPLSIGANTSGPEQTFTIPGLQVGDFVDVAKPTIQPGISLGNARVSAANTLAVQFVNATAGTLTPTAGEVYSVGVTRPENLNAAGTASVLALLT
jgi:hypothetical protein